MQPESLIRSRSLSSFAISRLAWVSHHFFNGFSSVSSACIYFRLIVRLSSQNQTTFLCHQYGKLSYAASLITSSTGRSLNPGFSVGTVQKEHVKGHPLVACITFLIKNLFDSRSYRGVGRSFISQGLPEYNLLRSPCSISLNSSPQADSASPVTMASKWPSDSSTLNVTCGPPAITVLPFRLNSRARSKADGANPLKNDKAIRSAVVSRSIESTC